ncbi:biopolymer transporter ExbD [bacterium]|nr:biopolymer transporter ExbD [bacterium]
MALRPSRKLKHMHEVLHTDITPMMNLMVVLIPLLLTSAEFVRLGVIELNLPSASQGPISSKINKTPQEAVKKLDLAVTITDKGFYISSSMAVLSGKDKGEPSIALKDGKYDFEGLTKKLYEIKMKSKDRFPDTDKIIIMAEPNIDYQTLVSTMDASRAIKLNEEYQDIFPDVLLSAGIF